MPNQVITDFIVNLGNSPDKVASFKNDIAAVDTDLNNLGKNSQVPATFDKITKDIRAHLTRVKTDIVSLKETTESQIPKPTISPPLGE